ncbi:MAG: rod shape-determining protein MreD, partial [Acidimicrobiales bacterium]
MSPALRARLRLGALVVAALVAQATFGSDLRIWGVAPDLMALLAVCAGLAGGPEQGAVVGFFAGAGTDLLLAHTPFGLSALALCLTGFAVGLLRAAVIRDSRLLVPAVAFAGVGMAVALFLGVGDLVGETQLAAEGRAWLLRVALVEGAGAAALAIPAAALVRRAATGSPGAARLGGTA